MARLGISDWSTRCFSAFQARASASRLVLFDLDDTLYSEASYLKVAFDAIDTTLVAMGLCSPGVVSLWLADRTERWGRDRLLDSVCNEFGLNTATIPAMLNAIRNVDIAGGLKPFRSAHDGLVGLGTRAIPWAIVSNGNVTQQRNKWRLLRPNITVAPAAVVFAAEVDPKPSPACLIQVAASHNIDLRDTLFVGDSDVDREASVAAGAMFLHVEFQG